MCGGVCVQTSAACVEGGVQTSAACVEGACTVCVDGGVYRRVLHVWRGHVLHVWMGGCTDECCMCGGGMYCMCGGGGQVCTDEGLCVRAACVEGACAMGCLLSKKFNENPRVHFCDFELKISHARILVAIFGQRTWRQGSS